MTSDATAFVAALAPYRRRLRVRVILRAALVACAAAGLSLTVLRLAGQSELNTLRISLSLFTLVVIVATTRWRSSWADRHAAEVTDRGLPSARNTIVTAEAIAHGRLQQPHNVVALSLFHSARELLRSAVPSAVVPLGRHGALATLAILATMVLAATPPARGSASPPAAAGDAADPVRAVTGDVVVMVSPPPYTGRAQSHAVNPEVVRVIEGSRVRLLVRGVIDRTSLVRATGRPTPFQRAGDDAVFEFTAAESEPLVIRQRDDRTTDRLIDMRVDADRPASVRIERPGKDLVVPDATPTIDIGLVARDEVGLSSLVLRYTRVAGSGETFTFEEGEWPVVIDKTSTLEWVGRATLPLSRLGLADGDTLIYRAVARDTRPGADASTSESFVIEVGRLSGIAATGFALPPDLERQAISQQMVIIKTERLLAARPTLSDEMWREQAQLLAAEQRQVKAEFVFMTGGEVQDEVEEAAHSHEIAEGRLENAARVELFAAIQQMSRAETRLNAGDVAAALPVERLALAALQRAFDRRRYLLRTLPERTRIDPARRLTGESTTARSSTAAPASPHDHTPASQARRLMRDLVDLGDASNITELAAELMRFAGDDEKLRAAASALANAPSGVPRRSAADAAQLALSDVLRRALKPGAELDVPHDAMKGLVADEQHRRNRRR